MSIGTLRVPLRSPKTSVPATKPKAPSAHRPHRTLFSERLQLRGWWSLRGLASGAFAFLAPMASLALLLVFAGFLGLHSVASAQSAKSPGSPPSANTQTSTQASSPGSTPSAPASEAAPAGSAGATSTPSGGNTSGSAGGGAAASAVPNGVQVETTVNPYGLDALWAQGDFVARGTLIIMLIMSVGTWYVGVVKLLEQARLLRQLREARESFWNAETVQAGASALSQDSAVRYIAESGLKADANHRGTLGQHVDKHTWIGMAVQQSVDTINGRLQTGLAFLATVGSTAPFVGLFGTVWGIYHALTAIGVAGQASIDKVAGPVGEALIMTAIGLGAAVPAVMGYNWLVRRNKVAMEQIRRFASDVHAVLLGGSKELRS